MNKTLLPLAVVALLLSSCGDIRGIKGNGDSTTENRPAEPFTEIEASGAYTIEWAPGSPSIAVTTDQNLIGFVKTRVSGGTLEIETSERINPTKGIKVVVTGPSLEAIDLTGAPRFTGRGVTGERLKVSTTGAARVDLEGQVNALIANHTGASKLYALGLQAQKASLDLTGASDAEINVQQTLEVDISGAGRVTYKGNPQILRQDIAGAGKIRRKD